MGFESMAQRAVRQLTDLPGLRDKYSAFPVLKRGPAAGGFESLGAGYESFDAQDLQPPAISLPWCAPLAAPQHTELAILLGHGRAALQKLASDGAHAKFAPGEEEGLEAIILLEARPVILVQNGKFFPPPAEWSDLEQARARIEATFPSVGRIDVKGHPRFDWVGTGFLVSDEAIMTNRHVAKEFAAAAADGTWRFEPGMSASIDYVGELAVDREEKFDIVGVIGVHDHYDLALLQVARDGAGAARVALPLASASAIEKNDRIYVVGYPAWDGLRNDPGHMRRIFSNIYEVKRLQPGEVQEVIAGQGLFRHDCSTLGGNSGSCVMDLDTHQVIGLHFGGRYREANTAVHLRHLVDDPLLKKAKVNFA